MSASPLRVCRKPRKSTRFIACTGLSTWSVRKIARHLHLGRRTISRDLATPARTAARRQRASKLDPFKATIAEWLEQDPNASAMVMAQRRRPLGFTGGLSMSALTRDSGLRCCRSNTAAATPNSPRSAKG
ncbi:MAG: hypothetical protein WCA20_33105 [Candidatus Sulfotelmatobacter sp.]